MVAPKILGFLLQHWHSQDIGLIHMWYTCFKIWPYFHILRRKPTGEELQKHTRTRVEIRQSFVPWIRIIQESFTYELPTKLSEIKVVYLGCQICAKTCTRSHIQTFRTDRGPPSLALSIAGNAFTCGCRSLLRRDHLC